MVYKKFSKKLFDQNDPLARQKCKSFYLKQGITLVDNPDKYGPDLIDSANSRFFECEIKKVWNSDIFPYGSVQFPERKAKYVYQSKLPVTFFMLNSKCNKALVVEGQDLLKSPLKAVRNVYVSSDEAFFQVPLDKVKFVDVE